METIEFFYIKFFFSPSEALIPRLETENLVREAIKIIKDRHIETLIDVGTGTGIIPISIEKNTTTLKNIYGIDLSESALKIAQINKDSNTSKIELIKSNLLEEFLSGTTKLNGKNIIITANLPYIKDNDWENMGEDVKEEPIMALFGGPNTGFELYEKFFNQVIELKKMYSNKEFSLICEFGYDQSDLAHSFFVDKEIEFKLFSDLSGVMRFIYVQL
ncbi:MAG: HemK family protein methyltransferase [Candidatus Gracilibacteria bacterium]|nr:HemK family protein methyltransferase [Candidatus Gracilibacteria bacterium]MDD2908798.1 HemK family protein methyltransferase [Candidatus Gracilibacteria bacterium]